MNSGHRAAIYSRISLDKSGKRAGVERQRADCEALCERRGWVIVDHFEDNDRSAYSGRERPAYEKLTEAVAAGQVDIIVAWHSDRLWRSVLEQQVFLALGRETGLKLVATPSGDFDPSDADDSFMSTLLTAVAQKESADKSRRMKRKQLDMAQRGEFKGGPRAYGHTLDRTKVVAREAKVIREVVHRFLQGEAVHALVVELNRRGVQTARGGKWRSDTMKDLLIQPRLAGLRDYKGKVVSVATWPAIIKVEEHERILAVFESRRLNVKRVHIVRKYLLGGGLLRCSKCGHGLKANMIEGVPRYQCPSPALGGCSGTTIVMHHADNTVRDLVLNYLDSPAFARAVTRARKAASGANRRAGELLEKVTSERARLTQLGDMLADGRLDPDEYGRLRGRIEQRLEDAQVELRRMDATSPAADLQAQGATLRAAWEAMARDERRTVIGAVAEHFVVMPAVRPVNVFRAERVQPAWRFAR
jgi:Site-specific recombinases, DNA invertase Pin homologs